MKSIEERISKLEKNIGCPGTILQRTLMARSVAIKEKITIALQEECVLVWSLGIGGLNEPKSFFYDRTIEGVIKKAEKARKT